jgi:hypothetical protein
MPANRTSYDPDTRRTAIFVGLMFLTATATFLAGHRLLLSALAPPDASGNTTQLAAGVVLHVICAVAGAAIGGALVSILAGFDRRLVYGYFAFRSLEGLVIVAAGAYMLATKTLINYEPIIYVFTGVAGLMFTTVLLRTDLVPTWLARLGFVGYVAILAVLPIELAGVASLDSMPGALLYVPGGLFELFLPILLIARGFRTVQRPAPAPLPERPHVAATHA